MSPNCKPKAIRNRWVTCSSVGCQRAGTAVSQAADNKGRRDRMITLHPAVIEHLRRLPSFSPMVFPWNHNHRAVLEELVKLQKEAKIKAMGGKKNYGFHDLRRAFATLNAPNLSADQLQQMMLHKDYTTTQRYINMANQMTEAVEVLFVPELRKAGAG